MQKNKKNKKVSKKSNNRLITIATVSAVVIVLAVILSFTLMGKPANPVASSKQLTPTSLAVGQSPGIALVVYDPGSNGAAKTVADDIASDLQTRGYFVDLAGIDSSTAKNNATGYQLVVVGGPISGGNASSAVQTYLKNISPGSEIVGVYGVTSSKTDGSNDQVAPLPTGSTLIIKETLEINKSQKAAAESSTFINQLLN